MTDLFTLTSSALPDSASFLCFRGVESLGRPYEFEVFFTLTEAGDFDLADAVGSRATILGDRGDGRDPFRVHGVFASIELLFATPERALFRGLVVPHLWQLGQSRHSRIFTKRTVVEIIEAILLDGGLTRHDFAFRLGGSYEPEEHVCQYMESDLDFIHRWMEMEGLYYFFEHGDDGEKLIVTDTRSTHKPGPAAHVRYRPTFGYDASAGEAFDSFTCRHSARPAMVSVRDYDYGKPTLDLSSTATVSPTGFGEMIHHAGRFSSAARGKHLARIRAEELLAVEVVAHASGTALGLRAGYTFALEEHPISAYETSYLAVELRHVGNQAGSAPEVASLLKIETADVYRVEVTAIKAEVQHRLPRRTPWPRIYGYEIAFIDGAADSEYAQLDDQGRYSVKFRFDESDLKDGQGSTWVRMMQPHGGGAEGWHFPLRKGVEVVVSFLGGDPDRPVISGVVPNALTPSPVTSGNNTTNVIQTGGRNRIELEDMEGSQRVTMSSPTMKTTLRMGAPNDDFHFKISSQGNGFIGFDQKFDNWVKGDWTSTCEEGNVAQDWRKNLTTKVGGVGIEEYGKGLLSTVETGPRIIEVKSGDNEMTVKGDATESVGGTLWQSVGGWVVQKFDGTVVQGVGGGFAQYIAGNAANVTEGEINIKAKKLTINLSDEFAVHSYGQTIWNHNAENQIYNGDQASINVRDSAALVIGKKLESHIGQVFSANLSANVGFNLGVSIATHVGPRFGIYTSEEVVVAGNVITMAANVVGNVMIDLAMASFKVIA